MPKLNDTQLVILSAAAQRDGGAVLPPPKRLKVKGGAFTSTLKSLLRKGLVNKQPAPPDAPAWRESDDGRRFMLTVSSSGLEAIGVEPEPKATARSAMSRSNPKRRHKTARVKSDSKKKPAAPATKQRTSKQDTIGDRLRQTQGATIADLQTATGWQPHSVRAALTGLRKKGHEIIRSKADGAVTRYRIADDAKGAQR